VRSEWLGNKGQVTSADGYDVTRGCCVLDAKEPREHGRLIMQRWWALCVLLIAVIGCAPMTSKELREKYACKDEFSANDNYQSVYKKILHQMRNCYQSGVQGDVYPGFGNVTVTVIEPPRTSIYVMVDVSAIDDTTTKVTVYKARSQTAERSCSTVVREWVLENSTECKSERPPQYDSGKR
jgi:hypothetical protein